MRKIITLFIIGLGISTQAQTNLVSNSDFEGGDNGWTNSGAVSRTIVSPGHESNQAFEVVGAVNKGAQYKAVATDVTEDAYELSFWAKGTAGETAKLKVKFTDTSSEVVSGTFGQTDVWEFFKHTYQQTAVKTIDKFIVQCGSGTAAAPMTFVTDDLFFGVSTTGVDPVDPIEPEFTAFPFETGFESNAYNLSEVLASYDGTTESDIVGIEIFDRFWRGNKTTAYTATVDSEGANGSTKAMKIAITTKAESDISLRTLNIPVGTYEVTFYAKTDAAGVGVADFFLPGSQLTNVDLSATYTKYTNVFEVVANANGQTRLVFFKIGDITATTSKDFNVWIDDVQVKEHDGTPTSIEKSVESQIKFYPNPVQSTLNIQTVGQVEAVEIYSLTGQKVLDDCTGRKYVNVADLNKGIYIVMAKIDGQNIRQKIIKQ